MSVPRSKAWGSRRSGRGSRTPRDPWARRLWFFEQLEPRLVLTPFPAPLEWVAPPGSLVYQREGVSGNVAAAGETDSFRLSLGAGQTATVLLEPQDASLQARLRLLDPSSSSIATAEADDAGQRVLLQTVLLADEGVYQIDVTSLAGAGDYQLSFYLNAAVEEEIGGGGNDTRATAQDIDGAAMPLGAGAQRLAVLGTIDIRALLPGQAYSIDGYGDQLYLIDAHDGSTISSLTVSLPGETIRWMNGLALDPTTGEFWALASVQGRENQRDLIIIDPHTGIASRVGNTGDNFAGITFDESGTLYSVTGDGAAVPETLYTLSKADATPTVVMTLGNGDGGETLAYNPADGLLYHGSGQDDKVFEAIDLATGSITDIPMSGSSFDAFRGLGYAGEEQFLLSDGQELYQISTRGEVARRGSLDHGSKGFVTTETAIYHSYDPTDVYRFSLLAGQAATLVLEGTGRENAALELLDADGQLLAIGSAGSISADFVIADFVAPEAGIYYARVQSDRFSRYQLVVTRGATLENEMNDEAAEARDIGVSGRVLGALGTADRKPIRVAVLDDATYPCGDRIAEQLNDDTYFDFEATTVFNADLDTVAELRNYDVVVLGHQNLVIAEATAAAIREWYQQGLGGVVGTSLLYSNLQNASAVVRPIIDVAVPLDMSTSNGRINAYYVSVTDGSHPVTSGVADFSYGGESSVNGADAGSRVLATNGAGGAPTVIVKEDGGARSVWLGMSYFSTASTSTLRAGSGDRLLEQAVAWAGTDRVDQFLLQVNPGDALVLETTTPGDGTGEPQNSLDPRLELFDQNGVLVAADDDSGTGRNARLTFDVPADDSGAYRVAVRLAGGAGPYLLTAENATGDPPPLQVVQTSPAEGAITPDFGSYRVTFSNSLLLTSVQAEDLQINGQPAASFGIIDDRTVEFDITSANHGDGTYQVSIGANAVRSVSGIGVLPFSTTFHFDAVPSLAPKLPLGSLIYDASAMGHFSTPADVDTFHLELDAGQTVTVRLTPQDSSIQGQIELLAPGGGSLGTATAATARDDVLLQTISAATKGTYHLRTTSLAGAGPYELWVLVNAAAEEEETLGIANDTPGTAQSIDSSSVAVSDDADRLGVVGRLDGDPDYFRFELGAGRYATLSLACQNPGAVELTLWDAAGTLLARGSQAAYNDQQRITGFVSPAGGTYFARVEGDANTEYALLVTRDIEFMHELNDTLSAAQEISLTGQALGFLGYLHYADLILADRPVAYWRMGEESGTVMVDSSGVGLDGAYQNGVALGAIGTIPGDADTAARFDGVDDYAIVPDADQLRPQQLTVEAWVYADSNIQRGAAVVSKMDDSWDTGYALWWDGYPSTPSMQFFADPYWSVSAPVAVNRWSHVVGTYDGVAVRILVDGVEMASLDYAGPLHPNQASLRIGYDDEYWNWKAWSGFLDEIAIYDTALSPARIQAHAAANLAVDVDFYSVQVAAGDELTITTATPSHGSGEPANHLDPFLELYDEDGSLIATDYDGADDGGNAKIQITVPAEGGGTYRVAVRSEGGTGTYVLSIDGATAAPPPFRVTATLPDDEAVISRFPEAFQVHFSQPLLLSSVEASDLSVNGQAARTVRVVDQDTLEFDIAFAHAGDGRYDIEIPAGAILSLGNQPLEAFSLALEVDVTPPFSPLEPLGSLIYETSGDGLFDAAGDRDQFLFEWSGGQSASVVLMPHDSSIQAAMEWFAADGTSLGSASAASAGETLVLQTVTMDGTGLYRLEAHSVTGQGTYELRVLLNAAAETETFRSEPNNTLVAAQPIDGSAVALQASADRLAVLGQLADAADIDLFSFGLHNGQLNTIVLTPLDPGTGEFTIELLDAAGNLVALGTEHVNGTRSIDAFAVDAGLHFARVTGDGPWRYSLVLLRGADFEREPNNHVTSAQLLDPMQQVLGFITADIPSVEPDDFDAGERIESPDVRFSVENWPEKIVVANRGLYRSTGEQNFGHREPAWFSADGYWSLNYALRADFVPGVRQVSIDVIGANWNRDEVGVLQAFDAQGNLLDEARTGPLPRGQVGTITVEGGGQHIAYVLAGGDPAAFSTPSLDNLQIVDDRPDHYAFLAQAGDEIELSTATPAGGAGEFYNDLDPLVVLLDPSGQEVARDDNGAPDGRNALLRYVVPGGGGGVYQAVVLADATVGEYTLAVNGTIPPVLPFQVIAVPHASDEILALFPGAYRVDLSGPMRLNTPDRNDLLVKGYPADSVTVIDGDTLEFDISSLNVGDGRYSIRLPGGGITSMRGVPLTGFTTSFILDSVSPTVASSSIQDGEVIRDADWSFEVIFSETMATNGMGPEDVILTDTTTGTVFTHTGFSYTDSTNTLTVTYGLLRDGIYRLTLVSGAEAFRDVAGRPLDGAGDGGAADFVVNFAIDSASTEYPTPLAEKLPSGSLIYESATEQFFHESGDMDPFLIDLDAGQTVTVLFTPRDTTVQGRLELRDPGGESLAAAAAAEAGQPVLLQTVPVNVAGVYCIEASSLAGNGAYEVRLWLNAALEEESVGGAANDDWSAGQTLVDSALSLPAGASRLAVVGNLSDADDVDVFAIPLAGQQPTTFTLAWQDAVTDASTLRLELLDATGALLTVGVGQLPGQQVIPRLLVPGGEYLARVRGTVGGDYTLVITRGADLQRGFPNVADAAQRIDPAYIVLAAAPLEIPHVEFDYFVFHAAEGDPLSLRTTTPGDGGGQPVNRFDPQIELFDPWGRLVGQDDHSAPDGRNARIDYLVPAGSGGDYLVRVGGSGPGPYTLQVLGATPGEETAPRVVSSRPREGQKMAEPPTAIDLTLSEAVYPSSLEISDLVIDGGASATAVELLDGATARFHVRVPDVAAVYTYQLRPEALTDLQGQGSLAYQGTFEIDRTGPRVIQHIPTQQVASPFTQLTFVFDEPIDPASFTTSDVALFEDRDGRDLRSQVTEVTGSGTTFTVHFRAQGLEGFYRMEIGPAIQDVAGNPMDQDGNGTAGEATNRYAASVHLQSPDLRAISISGPSTAELGQEVRVEFSVENIGSDPALEDWSDQIFLSTDAILDGGDRLLTTVSAAAFAPLASGTDYSVTVSVTLPLEASLLAGDYFLILRVDGSNQQPELLETNNTAVSDAIRVTVPPVPDLVVSEIAAPVEAISGRQIPLSWTITNQGDGPAIGPWTDQLFLAMAPDAVTGNLHLGSFAFDGTLSPGESVTRTQNVPLPINVSGARYVMVKTDTARQVFEHAGEMNNTLVADRSLEIRLAPHANLQVASVAVPGIAFSGQTVVIEWIVTNHGTGPTNASDWSDTVYLSADAVLDVHDLLLATVVNPAFLGPGDSYASRATVTLPRDFVGEAFFLVVADSANQVFEHYFEHDNIGVGGPVDIQLTPPPDLQVTNVIAPASAFSGQPITLKWTVQNRGANAALPDSWFDTVHLSSDSVLDEEDPLLKTVSVAADGWACFLARFGPLVSTSGGSNGGGSEPLAPDPTADRLPACALLGGMAPGQSYDVVTSVTLPVGVSGEFYFLVTTDAPVSTSGVGDLTAGLDRVFEGPWETNNTGFDTPATTIILTPPPDLEVSNITAPSTALAGHELSVSYRVTNAGASHTPNTFWQDRLFLSADDVLDPDTDLLLATRTRRGALGVDQSYEGEFRAKLSDDLQGEFFVIVETDSEDLVFELNNANTKVAGNTLTVEARPADLRVELFTAPATAVAGRAVLVDWTIHNAGSGDTAVDQWTDRVYLSTDAVLDDTDSSLGFRVRRGALAAGHSYAVSGQLIELPLWVATGDYYLILATDTNNQVFEAGSEDNNFLAIPISVVRETADLEVISVTAPGSAASGQIMTVEWTVRNTRISTPRARLWLDEVFLSVDPVLDATDVSLGRVQRTGALLPTDQYTVSRNCQVPLDLSGNFFVIVRTDVTNVVLENPSEDNNDGVTAATTNVTLSPVPDLAVTSVDAPDTGISGQPVQIGWTVKNTGGASTGSGGWNDVVYLSLDQVLDRAHDVYLGFAPRSQSLAPDESYHHVGLFEIPKGLSGPYYVFVVTDRANKIHERGAEANNVNYAPRSVELQLLPPADLVVGTITIPATGIVGQMATITYTVENRGTHAAEGRWTDVIYLSVDDQWDIRDALFGRVEHVGDVPGGGSYSETLSAPLPGVLPGTYHVIVRSDILNRIPESDVSNNVGASLDGFSIDVEELFLGTPHAATIGHQQSAFFRLDVPRDETLLIRLDAASRDSTYQLFVRYGEMPTRTTYDLAGLEPFEADQQVIVPRTQAGVYYLLVHGQTVPSAAADSVTLEAKLLQFSILDTDYGQAGVGGRRTLEINGARFDRSVMARLVDGAGEELPAGSYWYVDETKLFATFDLQEARLGMYDVVITNADGATATVVDGLEVVAGGSSDNRTFFFGVPPALKRPQHDPALPYHVSVGWANDGLNDAFAPLLWIDSTTPLATTPGVSGVVIRTELWSEVIPVSYYAGQSLVRLGVSKDGPPGLLLPGQFGELVLFGLVDAAPDDIELVVDRMGKDPLEPFDWPSLRDALVPEGMSDEAFAPVFAQLIAQVGDTWGDYLAMLSQNASLLPAELGRHWDPGVLIELELRRAQAAVGTSIAGRVVARDFAVEIAGQTITALNLTTNQVFTTTTLTDGSFLFDRVTPGEYLLRCETAIIASEATIAVAQDQAVSDVLLVLQPGGTVSGTVRAFGTQEVIAAATVRLFLDGSPARSTKTDTAGRFTFSGLPPGDFTLVAEAPAFARAETAGLLRSRAHMTEDVFLGAQATMTGILLLPPGSPDNSRTDILVTSLDTGLRERRFTGRATSEEFRVGGLPAGRYEVSVSRAGHVTLVIPDVLLAPGENRNLGPLVVPLAASVSGVVSGGASGVSVADRMVGLFLEEELTAFCRTDDTGAFSFEGLEEGSYRLSVIGLENAISSKVDITLAGGAALEGVDVCLWPGGVVEGTVVDGATGARLVGIQVFLLAPSEQRTTTTDGLGQFRFGGLELGDYSVLLPMTGAGSRADFVVATGADRLEFPLTLSSAARIQGQVLGDEGAPIPGSLVTLWDEGVPIVAVRGDEYGRYGFGVFRAGDFELRASAEGVTFPRVVGLSVALGDTVERDLQAGLARLEVALVDGTGQAVSDATVFFFQWYDNEATLVSIQTTDGHGHTTLSGLADGDYRVQVVLGQQGQSAAVSIRDGADAQMTVELASLLDLSGRVSDHSGRSVAHARVTVYSTTDSRMMGFSITDANGQYRIGRLVPGSFDIVVLADGFGPHVVENVSIDESTQQDVVVFASTSVIAGRIVDPEGNPVPLGFVTASDSSGRILGDAVIQPDGTFTLRGPAGNGIVLHISAPGFADRQLDPIDPLPDEGSNLGDNPLTPVAVGYTMASLDEGFRVAESNMSEAVAEADPLAAVKAVGAYAAWPQTSSLKETSFDITLVPSVIAAYTGVAWIAFVEGIELAEQLDADDIRPLANEDVRCCGLAYRRVLRSLDLQDAYLQAAREAQSTLRWQVVQSSTIVVAESARAVGAVSAALVSLHQLGGVLGIFQTTGGFGASATLNVFNALGSVYSFALGAWEQFQAAISATSEADLLSRIQSGGVSLSAAIASLVSLISIAEIHFNRFYPTQQCQVFQSYSSLMNVAFTARDILTGALAISQNVIDSIDAMSDTVARFADARNGYRAWVHRTIVANQWYETCLETGDDPGRNRRLGDIPVPHAPDDRKRIPRPGSVDPNDIQGPAGFGELRHVSVQDTLDYRIRFENDPELATAPAQRVLITQQLDSDLDFRSFRVGDFGFGEWFFAVPDGQGFYSNRLDLTESHGIFLDVMIGVDVETGQVFWDFSSVDPATGDLPANPFLGFLPPNDDGIVGQGFVNYSIRAVSTAPTNAVVDALATIVFDINEPLDTPPIFNTLDARPPSSFVAPLPAEVPEAVFGVSWSGNDDPSGSGLAGFTIFVSEDEGPFAMWLENTLLTEASYVGVPGKRYSFYSLARDNAGNVEESPATPDATTTVRVANAAPHIDVGPNDFINKGERFSRTLTIEDPDTEDSWTVTIQYGDGSEPVVLELSTRTFELDHVYAQEGQFTVRVLVTDANGASAMATATVTVRSVTLTALAGGPYTVSVGGCVVLAGSGIAAGGANVPLTFEWDLDGDGIFGETAAAAERGDEVSPNPTFCLVTMPETEVVIVSLRVRDDEGQISAVDTASIAITCLLDFGDLPDLGGRYPTLRRHNGARHVIGGGLFLGQYVDAEPDGQPTADASGDDAKGTRDDEDGVTFGDLRQGQPATIRVTASAAGLLDAFIDFNIDGDFADAGEKIFDSVPVAAGINELTVDIPDLGIGGRTFARFRISSEGGLSYDGLASDGEVEDYQITIGQVLCFHMMSAGMIKLTVSSATPGGVVDFVQGTRPGTTFLADYGITVGLADPIVVAQGLVTPSGTVMALVSISPPPLGEPLLFQAVERAPNPRVSNVIATAAPLRAAGGQGPGAQALSMEALSEIAFAAIARWQEVGLSTERADLLASVTFDMGDLPNDILVSTVGTTITVDISGAGYGWFLDETPADDDEFPNLLDGVARMASEGPAADRVDLLTVILHELGHLLGLSDVAESIIPDHLMVGTLGTGIRRLAISYTNLQNSADVNADGSVAPNDALIVINILNAYPTWPLWDVMRLLAEDAAARKVLPDTNSDFLVTPADALLIINVLNRQVAGASGEGEGTGGAFALTSPDIGPARQRLGSAPGSRGSSGEVAAPAYGSRRGIRDWTKSISNWPVRAWEAARSKSTTASRDSLFSELAEDTSSIATESGAAAFFELESLFADIAADVLRTWTRVE